MSKPTIGELRVRAKFNPSASTDVDQIKQKSIELINLIFSMKKDNLSPGASTDFARWRSLAMTDFESAAMWGVKAATINNADYENE